jgi:predicted small lipoprotein YifL
MTLRPAACAPVAAVVAAILLGGCGLKGPLALPEKSETVIIRQAEGTAPETSPAPAAGTATGPTGPTTGTPVAAPPAERRPPPPPLPGGNPGTSRGG